MPRVKRGTIHTKKRRNLLSRVKGYKWGRKNLIRLARTATIKAGAHTYVDLKKKKRRARQLWQVKINAFVRNHDMSYSTFIKKLKDSKIELDRKVLADLAENNKGVMAKLIENLKSSK